MAFLNDDTRVMLEDSVDKFLNAHYDFHQRRTWVEKAPGYNREHWQRFAELGWLGLPFAERHGGLGGDITDTLGLMRRFGAALVVEPYLSVVGLGGQAIAQADNQDAADSLLPELVAGQAMPVLAWEESISRGNPEHLAASARRIDGGWRLEGEKVAVIGGDLATHFVVSAQTFEDDAGPVVELFLLQADELEVTGFPTMDGHRGARLTLAAVDVDEARRLTRDGHGAGVLRQVLEQGIMMMAAEGVGAMQTLLRRTLDYTRTRRQFGVPIASFQVLQHRMVDMYIAMKNLEHLLEATANRWDQSPSHARDSALLKAQLCQSGRYVGQQAVQLHGGIGMTDELDVGHYFKRLTALGLLFGDENYHLKRAWAAL
ncbi:pimeloyl-CoA dehydrogenase [Alcanivorax xiamenensis]|uniref:Pimeloyl-CoA dehydrogenase n=1 Tax=Alcanivorax xiamenensis TaxID=1177156 RepID=A0ABQ6Y7N2_9GAMM|nr:acyl-CoA dehydrogenase family protein [Alcanivorax xiamenensis]KAF0805052.1 pimeloyl-CoA dehydrogenase [Alcanivorax xiamenensis]